MRVPDACDCKVPAWLLTDRMDAQVHDGFAGACVGRFDACALALAHRLLLRASAPWRRGGICSLAEPCCFARGRIAQLRVHPADRQALVASTRWVRDLHAARQTFAWWHKKRPPGGDDDGKDKPDKPDKPEKPEKPEKESSRNRPVPPHQADKDGAGGGGVRARDRATPDCPNAHRCRPPPAELARSHQPERICERARAARA
jgi:hypothetical protein